MLIGLSRIFDKFKVKSSHLKMSNLVDSFLALRLSSPPPPGFSVEIPRVGANGWCQRCVRRLGVNPQHGCFTPAGRRACAYCRAGKHRCLPVSMLSFVYVIG